MIVGLTFLLAFLRLASKESKSFIGTNVFLSILMILEQRKWGLLCALLILLILAVGNAYGYGKSVEDLVGVFSIEKNIRLGSSGACFGNSDAVADQLDPALNANPVADNEPPALTSLDLKPKIINSPSRSIGLRAHISDDQSGLSVAKAWFRSPSGGQLEDAVFSSQNRNFGTSRDGIYATNITIPEGAEKGVWFLENLTLTDNQGNYRILHRKDLIGHNLPAEFLVI